MSETAAVAPSAAPVAAPAAAPTAPASPAAPTESARPSFADVKARILGEAPASTPTEGATGETPPEDPWLKHIPQAKPQSLADRLAQKAAREEAQRQAQTYESRLKELSEQNQGLLTAQQQADAKFQQLIDANDVEGALKIKGVSLPFQELQRRELIRRGAITGGDAKDPRVDAMAKELDALKQERAAAMQRQQQAQMRAQQQKELQEYEEIVSNELSSLSVPKAPEFAKAAGVPQAVLQVMMQDRSLTTEQAAAIVYRDYKALYDQLAPIYGAQAPAAPQQQAQQPDLRARLTAPRAAVPDGAAPAAGVPPELKGAEKYAWIKRQIERGELGNG